MRGGSTLGGSEAGTNPDGQLTGAQIRNLIYTQCEERLVGQPVTDVALKRNMTNVVRGMRWEKPMARMNLGVGTPFILPMISAQHWCVVGFFHRHGLAFVFDPSGKASPDIIDTLSQKFEVTDISYPLQTDTNGCGIQCVMWTSVWGQIVESVRIEHEMGSDSHGFVSRALARITQEYCSDSVHRGILEDEVRARLQGRQEPDQGSTTRSTGHIGEGTGVISNKQLKRRLGYNATLRDLYGSISNKEPWSPGVPDDAEARSRFLVEMGESSDARELTRMAHMAGKGHVVLAATNSRGRGVLDMEYEVGDIGRLDRLAEMVQHRIVDVLAVCEIKIKTEHLQCLHDALRRRGLVYRTGLVDDIASRGVIVIWRKDFPYMCSKVHVDGSDKRVIVIKFRGAKGTSLVISCSYMENINQPVEVQNKMYNFVGQHVPPGRSHKHMFIDMGDKNCVLNTCQRVPVRNRVQENNRPLLTFARKYGLTEVVTEDAGATTPIYTRVDWCEGSKAKLDHIHINAAAHRAHSASGWTETNPVIPRSDHGIVWVALDPIIMQGIEPGKQEKREVIRTNGAKEVTHDKFPGCPMTLGGVHTSNLG